MYFEALDAARIAGALAPAFTAGFAVQQTIELVDTALSVKGTGWWATELVKNPGLKKLVTSLIGLLLAIILVSAGKFDVIGPLMSSQGSSSPLHPFVSGLITVIFISGGTEGFNSLLKFISWKKEEAKSNAANKPSKAAAAAVGS